MSISIVNGFLCFCSCDVAKALAGKNPHPSTDATKSAAEKTDASPFDGPAVLLGGSLAKPSGANTVNALQQSHSNEA